MVMNRVVDLAQTRFENAMALFEEFVRNTVKHPDAATLRGLERRFAERLLIQPSYWSQIKSRSRQIGERLARQFEQHCHKPNGWMDHMHGVGATSTLTEPGADSAGASYQPQDDDERFILSLVLSYYRRHPQRARARLMDLLGEVLTPSPPHRPAEVMAQLPARRSAATSDDPQALWLRSQQGVARLRQKK